MRHLLPLLLCAVAQAEEPRKLPVRFAFDPTSGGRPQAQRVCVAGEWNGWEKDVWPLERQADGTFARELALPPGVYRYKLVVDGEWLADPANALKEPDGHGNSVLVVGDLPAPDLRAKPPARPRPREARAGAFQVVEPGELPAPPRGVAPRELYVYLPPSWAREPERRFPAVWCLDGQNVWSDPEGCFGHGGWYLDATCEKLWKAGELQELVLIGLPNSAARLEEYGTKDLPRAGEAPFFGWLAKVLVPFARKRWRLAEGPAGTAILGSSMGGLAAFSLALSFPDTFGQAACLSSSFWWRDPRGSSAFELLAARGKQPVRLWLDSGDAGRSQDGLADTRRMAAALRETGWRDDAFQHHVEAGATHDEKAWRARARLPLRFLFPAEAR